MSSGTERNLIALHGPSSLLMSAASREREDALPQTPECTNSTGLFKEAAGKNPALQNFWPRTGKNLKTCQCWVARLSYWKSETKFIHLFARNFATFAEHQVQIPSER